MLLPGTARAPVTGMYTAAPCCTPPSHFVRSISYWSMLIGLPLTSLVTFVHIRLIGSQTFVVELQTLLGGVVCGGARGAAVRAVGTAGVPVVPIDPGTPALAGL